MSTTATPPAGFPPALYLLAAGNFTVGVGAFVVLGVMGPMSADLALTPMGSGWVITAYAIAYAVGSPTLTAITGARDRRLVLAAGLALFAAGMAIATAATRDASAPIYAGRVISAIGAGLYSPGSAAVAVAISAPSVRGRALAIVFGGLTLAQVVGIPLGAWLGYAYGWRIVFLGIVAGVMLLAAVLLAVLPRRLAVPAATLAGLAQVLTSPPLAVSVLFFATYLIGAWSAYAFIGPLIELKLGAGRDLVAALLAVYGLGAFVGSLVGGRVSDRLGHDRTLLAITIAAIPLVGLVTVVPWTVPTAAILLFVWAMVSWSAAVPQQARIIALAPDKAQVLLALNAACIYLGASGGASIAAATKASVGLVWTGPAGAVVGTLALAHLLLAMRLTRAT